MKKRVTFSWEKDKESLQMVGLPVKRKGKVVGKVIKFDPGALTAEISDECHKDIFKPVFENFSMGVKINNDPDKRSYN